MTDENKQRLQENCEEAALGLLMEEYAEIEGESLWREFQAAQAAGNGPETLQREDRNVSRGSEAKNRRFDFLMRLGKRVQHAAVIFLVLVCLFSSLVVSVEAFKIPVLNYIVVLEKKFSGLSFGNNEDLNEEYESLVDLICSVPCPEGYHVSDQQIAADGILALYFSHEDRNVMKITIYESEGQFNIDTEDVAQTSMKIQDYEVLYLQKNGHRLMLMDAERELVFDIRSFELEDEAFWRYAYALAEKLSH